MAQEQKDREEGVVIDLDRLEEQAKSLYLHRFVNAVQKARGEFGRYLTLRAGDTLAILAAGDGSAEWLERVVVDDASRAG